MLVFSAAEQTDDDEDMSDVDFQSDDFEGLSDDEAPELEDVEMPVSKKFKKEKN